MKNFMLTLSFLLIAKPLFADTFNLPEGITYRARAVGYDCGEFETGYKSAPKDFKERNIEYVKLAADKDLNAFLNELSYTTASGDKCSYGVYYRRDRETKSMNFERSEIVAENLEACAETKEWLDQELSTTKYYASKRGIRYIAFEIVNLKNNDICESGVVRTVFDRR